MIPTLVCADGQWIQPKDRPSSERLITEADWNCFLDWLKAEAPRLWLSVSAGAFDGAMCGDDWKRVWIDLRFPLDQDFHRQAAEDSPTLRQMAGAFFECPTVGIGTS